MAVSRALRRLLRIRDLEEEQCRLALESSAGELHRLQSALEASFDRDRRGRRLLEAGVRGDQLPDRLAGLEEMRSAVRFAAALEPRIEAMEEEVALRREEFILKRVERRQAETLIRETEAREEVENGRRSQQGLDDWYLNRMRRETSDAIPSNPVSSGMEPSRAAAAPDSHDREET